MYSYFAQVLEEHGPLETDHPLLVGELENFPPDAQKKIEESGGLKPFLLQSLRFVMKDNVIALMKHAGVLRNVTQEQIYSLDDFSDDNGPTLNPFAEEFYPTTSRPRNNVSSEDLSNGAFGGSSCQPYLKPVQGCQHGHHLQDSCFEMAKSSHSPFESTSDFFVPQIPFEMFNSAIDTSSTEPIGQCSSLNAAQEGKTELSASFHERGDGANAIQHGKTACNEQVGGRFQIH